VAPYRLRISALTAASLSTADILDGNVDPVRL